MHDLQVKKGLWSYSMSRIEEICSEIYQKTGEDEEIHLLLNEILEIKKRRDFRLRKLRAEIWDKDKTIFGLKKTIDNKARKLEQLGIPQGRENIQ